MRIIKHLNLKIFILMTGAILSMSTSTWITIAIILTVLLFVSIDKRSFVKYAAILGITMGIVFMIVASSSVLTDIVNVRLFHRLTEGVGNFEPKDAAFLGYLKEHIPIIFFGAGPGGLALKLVPYASETFVARGSTLTPTYFFNRFIGEFGLIGLSIVCALCVSWYKRLARFSDYRWARYLIPLAAVALLTNSSVSLCGYLLIISAMVALSDLPTNHGPFWKNRDRGCTRALCP
jgi:hypothetical protein